MKLLVGLGNPGPEYARTRHNFGFMVLDTLASDLEASINKKQFKALTSAVMIGTEKVILAKPQTYMNLSGQSVAALLSWYNLSLNDLLVISDDMDLPLGRIRFKPQGGAGGHNGLASIIQLLGTVRFARLRLGIGRPPQEMDPVNWVLGRFLPEEGELLNRVTLLAADAVREFVTVGLERTMDRYNAL